MLINDSFARVFFFVFNKIFACQQSSHIIFVSLLPQAQRSAIKRIFEKDGFSSQYMVLCVSDIKLDSQSSTATNNHNSNNNNNNDSDSNSPRLGKKRT